MARILSDSSEANEISFPTGEMPGPAGLELVGIQELGLRCRGLERTPAFPYAKAMDSRLEGLCAELRNVLLARRQRIAEEIGRHPRPITACDVHFNHLLEERAEVSAALDRFDEFVASLRG
jgi:hypothetical protein